MNILVTLTFYHPHWTGLTAYAKRLAEGLAARGHQVTVLTSQHRKDLPLEEDIHGVHVVRVPYVTRVSRTVVMPEYPARLAQLLRSHDVVHIHTPMPELLLITAMARAMGRPSLITHQGDVVMPIGTFNAAIQWAMDATMTRGMLLSDQVVVHSSDYGRNSRFLAPVLRAGKLDAIYPPVELPEPQPDAIAALKREQNLEGKRLIGFAGRFVEEKGFDYLLQAVPLVRDRIPNAHFVYAGEIHVAYENFFERCRPLLEQQRDVITEMGLILDPQQMANFYGMCDLFALPSRTDCFPSVQIEALMSGTPLVTTDIPGAREVVQVSGMGRLVRARDPQALADGIVAVLEHRDQYRPTRDAVQEIFSMQRSLDAYEQALEQLCVRRSIDRGRTVIAPAAALHAVGAGATWSAVPAALPQRRLKRLTTEDHVLIERLVRNEADMAYRRRAFSLMDYLDLHDGDTVLDCGCGMGFYLMTMGRLRNIRLIGVDGDVSRLAWARTERVPAHLGSVDIHKLPFADNSFDKVLMTEVLEHLAEDRKAMQEIYRILKPGGVLALSVPHANYPFLWDPINKTLEALGIAPIRNAGPITGLWSNHWRLYTPETLRDVITSAGFTVEELEQQTHHAFPFIHFIVYSIGKPLIEHNLLPRGLRDSADRFRGERNRGSLLNPINLGVKLLRLADIPNDTLRGDEQTFVSIVVRAVK